MYLAVVLIFIEKSSDMCHFHHNVGLNELFCEMKIYGWHKYHTLEASGVISTNFIQGREERDNNYVQLLSYLCIKRKYSFGVISTKL